MAEGRERQSERQFVGLAGPAAGDGARRRFSGFPNTDIRTVEILKWAVEDVCRVWNIAPARLGQQSGGGAGIRTQTIAEQLTDLEIVTVGPLAKRMDAAMEVLLSFEERGRGLRIMSKTDHIGKGTLANKIEMLDRLVARSGAATIDEGRDKVMGWLPLPNGEGNKVYSPKGSPEQGGKEPEEDDGEEDE